MGENLARFLKLDRAARQPVVDEIGFEVVDILGDHPPLEGDLKVHIDARCGLSKPAERGSRLDVLDPLLTEDLERVGAR
jgi:hypothetical protein